jgi:Xaa-Pro aminopeptidase
MQPVHFYQLPRWVRIAAALTVFNTWVLIAEFVIDRYGLDEYLPFYRYGDICLWDIAIIIGLVWLYRRASRAPVQTPVRADTVSALILLVTLLAASPVVAQTPDPWPQIRNQRIEQLLPGAMQRAGADAWITLVRENHNDPLAAHVGGENAGGLAAILFFLNGDRVRSVALSPSGEATALRDVGVHDTVIAFQRGAGPDLWQLLAQELRARNPQKIAVNSSALAAADGLTFTLRRRLEEAIGAELSARLVSAQPIVTDWLAVKLPAEIAILKDAAQVTDRLIREAYAQIVPGKTRDSDVARYLKQRMRELHVEDAWAPEQNPNVNSGPDRGHSHATDRVIRAGDFIQTDFGIKVHGRWVTDIQRFAYVLAPGQTTAPPDALKKWEIAREGSRKVLQAIRPDAVGGDVDRVQRAWMKQNGSLDVMWSTGHPVGYWAHDVGPTLSGRETQPLRAGQVFAYDGFFMWALPSDGANATKTISVEEMAVVTATGAEYLIAPQEKLILIR